MVFISPCGFFPIWHYMVSTLRVLFEGRLGWILIGNKSWNYWGEQKDWRCIWLQFGVFVSLRRGWQLSCLHQSLFQIFHVIAWLNKALHRTVTAVMLCFVLRHYEPWFWQRLSSVVCLLEKLPFAGQAQLSKQSAFVFGLFVNLPGLHAQRVRSHEHFRDGSGIRGKDNIIFAGQRCKRTEAMGDNVLLLLS